MKKILVIGCCGAGKTTLARQLSAALGLPLVHLDRLFWCGSWQHVSQEEFDARLAAELQKPAWIIDGNYGRTMPVRLAACDTVLYLDYPRAVCLWGVLKRVISGYGKSRPDMGGCCPERFDLEFMKFVWNFNRTHREKFLGLLAALPEEKQAVIFRSRKEADRWLKALSLQNEQD